MFEKHFLPSCHDSRFHRRQKIKAQLLPHVLRLDVQGHNHYYLPCTLSSVSALKLVRIRRH